MTPHHVDLVRDASEKRSERFSEASRTVSGLAATVRGTVTLCQASGCDYAASGSSHQQAATVKHGHRHFSLSALVVVRIGNMSG